MKIDDGGPAFPTVPNEAQQLEEGWVPAHPGMSLRAYYAGCPPPMPEQWEKDSLGDGHHVGEAFAAWACFYADALIAELKREPAQICPMGGCGGDIGEAGSCKLCGAVPERESGGEV